MIIKMNDGRCEIRIENNSVNILSFLDTTEKDEFLYNLYNAFKVKHKRDLWNSYVSITNDDFETIESKSFDVFTLDSSLNNLDDDKEFQKLLTKYISTLEYNNKEIDKICSTIQENVYALVSNITSEIGFINLSIDDSTMNLTNILKGFDIKCVTEDKKEFNTLEAKMKYLDLMSLISEKNKDNLYIILYPETGVGLGDQKILLDRIKKIDGTVLIITNSVKYLTKWECLDNNYIVFRGYSPISIDVCVSELRKMNNNYSCEASIAEIINSIDENDEKSKLIFDVLLN